MVQLIARAYEKTESHEGRNKELYRSVLDLKVCADILEKSRKSGEICFVHCNAGVG